MNTNSIALTQGKSKAETEQTDNRRKLWITALYFCSIGGFLTAFTGLFMSALEFCGIVGRAAQFNRAGTWLMVAAFPIVMLGAHALDKIGAIDETANKNRRAADEKIKIYEPLQWK